MAEDIRAGQKTNARSATVEAQDAPIILAAYARWAPVYDAVFGLQTLPGRRAAAAAANELPAGRVLDAGVGTGMSLPHYKPDHRVTGIDLSPEMLTRAQTRVAASDLRNVEALRLMDVTALDFEAASFDAVVAAFLVTVVPDPERALAEFARVTRPGGRVIIVSHFGAEAGLRANAERALAGVLIRLGWTPSLPESRMTGRRDLRLIARRAVQPLGLFTLLVFERL